MALRIALFGQAAFGKDVLVRLIEAGHGIAGVYTPPEGGRPDPLATEAQALGVPLLRHPRFRRRRRDGPGGRAKPSGDRTDRQAGSKGWEAIPEILEEYRDRGADLNVLAYVTAILPPEIVDAPPHGSLCFHPSLLPRFRGGAALAWQIILGERESGVTIFRPDAGIDTGPIVIQRGGVPIESTDTAASLYFERLYPLGVEAMLAAVAAVAAGTARYEPQDESRATFQGLVGEREARLDWSRGVVELDRLIRGCDPQPGAHAQRAGETIRLFDGRRAAGEDASAPGTIVGLEDGRLLIAAGGGRLAVGRVRIGNGKKVPAAEASLTVGERLD
ncbi:MAG: methionyl-tRNA formyltransferase [Myxococcales bacterium]|nr:methionyl-tRNA formyltransferase [Myxococcales bacterium]